MCRPASFIVTKKEVFWSKKSEGHEDIIEEFGLKERDVRGNNTFVRIEIIPPNNDYKLPFRKWIYQVDQDILPDWYDAKTAEKRCRAKLKEWRKCKVVMPKEKRGSLNIGEIIAIYGQVEDIYGSAQVKYIYGSAQVENIYGSAQVKNIYGSAQVKYIYGSAQVKNIYGSAQVKKVKGKVVICTYNSLSPKILKSSQAVLIDRSKDVVKCYVGKDK